jgi:hypothetical protein
MLVRVIPRTTNTLKFFAMQSPILITDFLALSYYRDYGITDENFCFDLLTILNRLYSTPETEAKTQSMITDLFTMSKQIALNYKCSDVIEQLIEFISEVKLQLNIFNLYQQERLNFNALWFEGNDSIIFFRVDNNDVRIPTNK